MMGHNDDNVADKKVTGIPKEFLEEAKKYKIDGAKLNQALDGFRHKAEEILKDEGQLDKFLSRLEAKLAEVPMLGDGLKNVPILVSLVRSFATGEYQLAPMGTIVAIVTALLYWISPIDLIPDNIPVAGMIDDTIVIALCWKMVETDVEEYKEWRDNR